MASLAKVATADLMAELQRRLNCAEKKEKNTIFIGNLLFTSFIDVIRIPIMINSTWIIIINIIMISVIAILPLSLLCSSIFLEPFHLSQHPAAHTIIATPP